MSDLIEVAFKGNRKEFFKWEDVVPPPAPPAHVIVEGDRGEDLGQVHATGELAEQRFAGVAHGKAIGDADATCHAGCHARRDPTRTGTDRRERDHPPRSHGARCVRSVCR